MNFITYGLGAGAALLFLAFSDDDKIEDEKPEIKEPIEKPKIKRKRRKKKVSE